MFIKKTSIINKQTLREKGRKKRKKERKERERERERTEAKK